MGGTIENNRKKEKYKAKDENKSGEKIQPNFPSAKAEQKQGLDLIINIRKAAPYLLAINDDYFL